MGENQPWDGRNTHFPAVYGRSYSAYDAYSVYSVYAAYSAFSAYSAYFAYSYFAGKRVLTACNYGKNARVGHFTDGSELRENAYFGDA